MPGRMQDKVVVVTGAAQGIGRGCAELIAREGGRVVVGDIQDEAGQAAVAAITEAGGTAIFQRADVVEERDCAALIEAAVTTYGRLDGLINNVGYYPRATLEETTVEFWDQILNVNLRGAFLLCKYAVPHMRAGGGGSVVNIGSINGLQALPNLVAYGAAKAGLLGMTRTLAGAYAADRIRFNYVIPGWVLSEGERALQHSRGVTDEQLQAAGAALALGRHQTPMDTAYACIYLLSDESPQVTGTIMHIDAGATTLPIQPSSAYVG
jgi:NAD(P)-dependent dehydrogenase (short-subunit alcohol dehydrogenase family)